MIYTNTRTCTHIRIHAFITSMELGFGVENFFTTRHVLHVAQYGRSFEHHQDCSDILTPLQQIYLLFLCIFAPPINNQNSFTTSSPPLKLNGGIPQGTKLGPILFAVMVNDLLPNWCLRAKLVADLTVLEVVPGNCPSLLGYVVSDVQSFSCNNNMCLNPPKCKVMSMSFLQYNSFQCPPIATKGKTLEQVRCFKFLGVYISEDLTWAINCDYIVKKGNRRLYVLRSLKRCGTSSPDIVTVYKSYLRIRLRSLRQLTWVQRRALRIIFSGVQYGDALRMAKIQSLHDRRHCHFMCNRFISTLKPENPVYNLVRSRIYKTQGEFLW